MISKSFLQQAFIVGFDLILVYVLVYKLISWVKRTHALNVIKGFFLIFVVFLLSDVLGLMTLNWMLSKFATALAVLLIVVFQPELRHFLEGIGASRFLNPLFQSDVSSQTNMTIIQHLLRTVEVLAKEKIGALIVLENKMSLEEFCETGLAINGELSSELLSTLFWDKSPTHDGAVILSGNIIMAAGCLLPLTTSHLRDSRLGTRHRAAIGISEVTDSLVIVVSEETGAISMCESGQITRFLNRNVLETRLFEWYRASQNQVTIKPYINPTSTLEKIKLWFHS